VQAFGVALLTVVSAFGLVSCSHEPRVERTGSIVWH